MAGETSGLRMIRLSVSLGSNLVTATCNVTDCPWYMNFSTPVLLSLVVDTYAEHACQPTSEVARWREGLASAERYRDELRGAGRLIETDCVDVALYQIRAAVEGSS